VGVDVRGLLDRPFAEDLEIIHAVQDVYLHKSVTAAWAVSEPGKFGRTGTMEA
jgi:hypothetical protein